MYRHTAAHHTQQALGGIEIECAAVLHGVLDAHGTIDCCYNTLNAAIVDCLISFEQPTNDGDGRDTGLFASGRIAKKVILVHRRDTLRATKIYHDLLQETPNIEFCWNSVVTELHHKETLTGIRLKDVHTGAETDLPCDGIFVSVGRKPSTSLFEGQLELDKAGYIAAGETTETSVPGVYAIGDVRTKPLRQVVTAVSDGAAAVHMAEAYLAEAGR